ncbi:hypothetical protein [Nocardia sp. NPDC051570]|uniref:hypothetical protein n=1 Tax=Nocardia sp. NPDC051570 TaxID=3364324 RepID=UPI00378FC147
MKASRIVTCASALVAAPVIMSAIATAAEPPSVDVATGKHWIVVTVQPNSDDRPEFCRVDPYFGTPQTVSLAVPASGNLFLDNVPAGPRRISVWCPNGGVTERDVVVA